MTQNIEFTLNGAARKITTDSRRTLLEVLREDLQLTGTKYGCGEGQCRACTVLLDGAPVQSCQTPIDDARGKRIETIESLSADGRLHPVQEAFLDAEAMQCGFCVPGMILSTVGVLRKNPQATEAQLIEPLNGHLCRCCGYVNILKAVRLIAAHAGKEAAR